MLRAIFCPLFRMWLTLKGDSYVMMCLNRKSTSLTPVIELQPSNQNDMIGKIIFMFPLSWKTMCLDVAFGTKIKKKIRMLRMQKISASRKLMKQKFHL